MKKFKNVVGKKKVLCGIMAAAMIMGMTACGNTAQNTETQAAESSPGTQTVSETVATEDVENNTEETDSLLEALSYTGEITAIDGSSITLKLSGEKPLSEASSGEGPNGEVRLGERTAGEAPDGEGLQGEPPAGELPSGERPEGEMPEGQDSLGESDFTVLGGTMTIEVTADTIITISGETATIDGLQVGDHITVLMEGEVVNSIILEG